jgi:hypothetical protein
LAAVGAPHLVLRTESLIESAKMNRFTTLGDVTVAANDNVASALLA